MVCAEFTLKRLRAETRAARLAIFPRVFCRSIFQPAVVTPQRQVVLHLPSQHHLCVLQGLIVEQPVQLCPLCRGVAVLVLDGDAVNGKSVAINAFAPSEEMFALGVPALRILALNFVFGSISVMSSYALQGFSKGVPSLIISAARQVIVLLPLAYVLGNAIGIYGIWWSFFISETVTVAFALLHLAGTEKKELDCISSAL